MLFGRPTMGRRWSRLLPPLVVLLLGASGIGQDGVRVLDLTRFVPPEGTQAGWGKGSPIVVTEGRPLTMARVLRLSLIEAIPSDPHRGDPLVYEVSLLNVGPQRLRIPWDPDWKSVQEGREVPPPGYQEAWLCLLAEDGKGRTWTLAAHGLYGSDRVATSLIELAPGDEVRLRAPGLWPAPDTDPTERSAELRVWARFSFVYGPATPNTEGLYTSDSRTFVLESSR